MLGPGRLDDIPLLCVSLDIINAKLNTDELYESTAVHSSGCGDRDIGWAGVVPNTHLTGRTGRQTQPGGFLCTNNLEKCQHLLSGNESNTYALITHVAVLGPNIAQDPSKVPRFQPDSSSACCMPGESKIYVKIRTLRHGDNP
jgi:hypothetical protein